MTILVTGAFGFLGCHLLAALAQRGDGKLVAVDVTPPDDVAENILTALGDRARVMRLDVSDRAASEALIDDVRPDMTIHAAAVTPSPTDDAMDPMRIVDINLGGSVSLIRALQHVGGGFRRFVLVSSAAVYGARVTARAASESDALSPQGLYGATKVAAETLVLHLAAAANIDCLVVRLGGLFGRYERPTQTRARMSPPFRLAAALRANRKIRVGGGDVAREYACADDVADAILRLLESGRWLHRIVNMGGDRPVTWRRMVELFAARGLDATWSEAKPDQGFGMMASDARPALDVGRLREMIGEWPRRSLDESIARLLAGDAQIATGEVA